MRDTLVTEVKELKLKLDLRIEEKWPIRLIRCWPKYFLDQIYCSGVSIMFSNSKSDRQFQMRRQRC